MPDAPDAIVCPSCGRKLSARAKACFYCRADVTGAAPAAEGKGGKAVCPVCHTEYTANAAGCPNCRSQTEKLVDMAERQRAESRSKTAMVIGAVLLLVFGAVGIWMQDVADESSPVFGIGAREYTACAIVALIGSIIVAFVVLRLLPRGDTHSTAWKIVQPLLVGAVGAPLWYPWALTGAEVINAGGVERPFPKVECAIVGGTTVRAGRFAELECKAGEEIARGHLAVQTFDLAPVGSTVQLSLAKGRLGVWMRDKDNPLWK